MICVELKATGNTVHKFLPSALLQRTFTLHKSDHKIKPTVSVLPKLLSRISQYVRKKTASKHPTDFFLIYWDIHDVNTVNTENWAEPSSVPGSNRYFWRTLCTFPTWELCIWIFDCSAGKDYDLCWACNHYRQHRSYIPGSDALLHVFVQPARNQLHCCCYWWRGPGVTTAWHQVFAIISH